MKSYYCLPNPRTLPPTIFEESDLHFEFPEHWGVRAYDDHRFYKNFSGLGLKGVDFLLIDPTEGGHLYLVEVKNYRTRVREADRYVAELKSAAELADTVAAKYEHTQRALGGIHLYYRRKWWYPYWKNRLTKSDKLQRDGVFWLRARTLAKAPERHTLVLVLETERAEAGYRSDLQAALAERLPGIEVSVGDQNILSRKS